MHVQESRNLQQYLLFNENSDLDHSWHYHWNRVYKKKTQLNNNLKIGQTLPFHGPTQFGLFDFQLRQQIHKPFEGPLIPIDPEEVHLTQIHDGLRYFTGPFEIATRTRVSSLPISVHDGLQNGCKWCDTDACCYQYGMLCTEYVAGWSSIWPININLHLIDSWCMGENKCRNSIRFRMVKRFLKNVCARLRHSEKAKFSGGFNTKERCSDMALSIHLEHWQGHAQYRNEHLTFLIEPKKLEKYNP